MTVFGHGHGSGRDLHRRDAVGTLAPVPPMQSGDSGDEDEVDGFEDDEFRPPLPAADRIWRHPSEVAAESRVEPRTRAEAVEAIAGPPVRWRSPQTIAALTAAAVLGAAISLGTVAALGGLAPRTQVVSERVAVQPVTRDEAAADTIGDIADETAPSIAAVRVHRDDAVVAGSATVFRSDGYLITNATLVRDATVVEVRTHDGVSRAAAVVGSDPLTDVAVLHIEAQDLRPAVFGTTDGLGVGDQAIAIGAPDDGGWSTSVSTGVVSALGRRLQLADGPVLHDMVLFDAPMASGLAGGPVLDAHGAVVGVTSGVPASSDDGRFGVATPIDTARHVARQIIEHGHMTHVWLGIEGSDLPSSDSMAMGLAGGAAVGAVAEGGPAAAAGIQPEDVIVGVDGTPVDSMSDLIGSLRTHQPGDEIEITVRRGADEWTAAVVLVERTTT